MSGQDRRLASACASRRVGGSDPVLCQAPFVGMRFAQNGDMTACCYNRDAVFGRYPETSIRAAWTGRVADALRARLAAADLGFGCRFCQEDLRGGRSSSSMMALYDEYAPVKAGPSRAPAQPRVFEFELRNTCNLECVMCSGTFSSAIRRNRERQPAPGSPYDGRFVEEALGFLPGLTDMKFVGGEPLLIDLYHRIWEEVAVRKPSLRVHVTTSGAVLPPAAARLLAKLNAGFVVSLDSLDPERYAWIRRNARLDHVLGNLEFLRGLARRRQTYCTLAVCPMTCNWEEIPELVRFAGRGGMGVYFNNVWWPARLSLRFLTAGELSEVLRRYEAAELDASTALQRSNRRAFSELCSVIRHWRDQAAGCGDRGSIARLRAELEAAASPDSGANLLERRVAACYLRQPSGARAPLPFLAPGDPRLGEELLALGRDQGWRELGLAFLSLKRRLARAILGPGHRLDRRLQAWEKAFRDAAGQEALVADNACRGLQVFLDILEEAKGGAGNPFVEGGKDPAVFAQPERPRIGPRARPIRDRAEAPARPVRFLGKILGLKAGALLKGSKVFCMAPWTHLHVLPTGKIHPCCMSAHLERNAIGDLKDGDTLKGAWNSEKMRELRRNMLAGRPSPGCERCYIPEANGLSSFRRDVNAAMSRHFRQVRRTAADGGLDVFSVPYLDLRFSNLCNFRCRTCFPSLSSGWHGDAVALGRLPAGSPDRLQAAPPGSAFMAEALALLDDAESVFFAGGEPLIMEEHYQVLERLAALKKWDTRIAYNTNCSALRHGPHDLLAAWRNFKNIYVLASLDGSGARGEYIRKGQDWAAAERNVAAMRRECPQARLVLAPTVSLFNALHLPDFFRELVGKGLFAIDEINVNILYEPLHYNVRCLPPVLKDEAARLYENFISGYLEPAGAADATREQFRAIVRYMRGGDLDCVGEFRETTLELDELRRESFADVFPELAELVGG